MKKTIIVVSLIIAMALLVAGCSEKPQLNLPEKKITVFKSPTCGCCDIYSKYMKNQGFEVEVTNTYDMDPIKSKYSIPPQLTSCHTTIVGDYFVEGHVPFEAVVKLLTEKPDIAGIGMPGMPSGSPGMQGAKQGQFVISAVGKDGSISEFMRI
ncbi:MAG TPA: DUF411 domain-containing protein [Candidatus Nanoarchaeia archaeon]|nr:DUF411 domain-containing protein [Candidatus Nanoarchaeia archaeon]